MTAPAGTAEPLVDTHVHLFSSAVPLAATAWTRPDADLTTGAFIAMMDSHGVGHAVISAMSLLGEHNDYTLDALRESARLRGTVTVAPTADPGELTRMKAGGVAGVRLMWRRRAALPDLGGPEYRALLRHVRELGWHVELNVEHVRLPPVLDGLLAAGVKVVVDHFGDPDRRVGYASSGGAALLRGLGTGRVWVKLSAGYRFGVAPGVLAGHAATLLRAAGPERLFWGSDAPFIGAKRPISYADAVRSFAEIVPDPEVRQRITRTSRAFYFGKDRLKTGSEIR